MIRPLKRLTCAILVGAITLELGSCYRAEIDLSPLADVAMGGTDSTPSGGSAHVPIGDAGEGGERNLAGSAGSGGAGGACHDPPPSADDYACRIAGYPTRAECSDQDPKNGWAGCYDGGCSVCTEDGELAGFPYYFNWHPCCQRNDGCSNHTPLICNGRCPQPTEHDTVAPCGLLNPNPG